MNDNKKAFKIDKTRLIIALVLTVVLIVISLVMAISAKNNRFDYKNSSRMFESVSDLSFLDEYVVQEDIKLDKNIFDAYEAYFDEYKTLLLDYNGNNIYVFAYTFSNMDFCLDYVKEVTNNNY